METCTDRDDITLPFSINSIFRVRDQVGTRKRAFQGDDLCDKIYTWPETELCCIGFKILTIPGCRDKAGII